MFVLNIIHNNFSTDIEEQVVNEKSSYSGNKYFDVEDIDKMLLSNRSEIRANPKKGDLNKDGKVDKEDLTILKEYLEGERELDEEQLKEADLNEDGVVNDEDYKLFLYGFLERRKLEERVYNLKYIYHSLFMGEKPAHSVSGIDNTDISAVRLELQIAVTRLAVLNTLI